jgi:hypothetical protein
MLHITFNKPLARGFLLCLDVAGGPSECAKNFQTFGQTVCKLCNFFKSLGVLVYAP